MAWPRIQRTSETEARGAHIRREATQWSGEQYEPEAQQAAKTKRRPRKGTGQPLASELMETPSLASAAWRIHLARIELATFSV